MNKQTIITALLALVAMAGQAQVRTGQDVCLRNEATGDWLIGLFDNYAVYNCEIWEYAKADTLKGEYMLRRGKDALKLKLKEGSMRIGQKNYTVSKLTERTLPDYPTKDESDFLDNGNVGGKVTLRGRIVNVPKGHGDRVSISIPDPLQTIFDNELPIECDSLGRFELDIELANTGVVRMLWAKLILTPGETYFISMDGQTGQTFVMGRDSRLSNELLTHDTPYYKVKSSDFDKKSDAELMEAVEKDYERVKEIWMTTEQASPMLSKRYRLLSRWQWKMDAAHSLVLRRYDSPDVRKSDDGQLWQWLRDSVFSDIARPYTLVQDDLAYTLDNYTSELLKPRNSGGYSFEFIEEAINIAEERNQVDKDSLAILSQSMNDYRSKVNGGTPDSLLSDHPFHALIRQMFANGTPLMQIIKSTEPNERILLKNIPRVRDLDLSEELKQLSQAVAIYSQLEQMHGPLSDALRKVLDETVMPPYYRDRILMRSKYFADLAAKMKRGNGCLMPNEPLADLKDGKEIMDWILEPYRGRIVYLDIWGTWCVPCKANLKQFTKPLHQKLRDLPVTYLYLCNNSSDKAWASVIAEYELAGEHSVHYNLPLSQQAAVEKYLGVRHYPTYILFDQNGKMLPGEFKPYDMDALRNKIEELTNTK